MPHTTHLPARHALVPARWQLLLHALAAMSLGIMAGFFWTYSANVNLAMQQMDASTYATVQSAFNRNVRHGLFFLFFFGTPVWCLLALASAWGQRAHVWWRCLAGATVLYVLGIIFFTQQVNLPLNRATEAWDPQAVPEGWALVRDQWNRANLWRTLANGVAFGTAVLALAARALAVPATGARDRAAP